MPETLRQLQTLTLAQIIVDYTGKDAPDFWVKDEYIQRVEDLLDDGVINMSLDELVEFYGE